MGRTYLPYGFRLILHEIIYLLQCVLAFFATILFILVVANMPIDNI